MLEIMELKLQKENMLTPLINNLLNEEKRQILTGANEYFSLNKGVDVYNELYNKI